MTALPYRICHFHIFKNAGTSIDKALQNHFGEHWSTFEGDHAHDIKTSAELTAHLNSHREIQAVSSHLCRPSLHTPAILPVVFIRHPLERARSVYEFTRLDPTQPFRESTTSSFADYLKWALSGAPGGVVIRDYQVIHLSSASFHRDGILQAVATELHFREARRIIDSWQVIGVVDQYAQSIELMETVYRQYFPDLKISYEHENVTNSAHRAADIEVEIGKELCQAFYEQNRFDYQLYDHACARLAYLFAMHCQKIEPAAVKSGWLAQSARLMHNATGAVARLGRRAST